MRAASALRFVLHLLVACATLAWVLPSHAGAVRSATQVQMPARDPDASYQRLIDATNAVVAVKVKALPNARSNDTLGASRVGSGVIIQQSLVLTIGYLVLEADQVEVVDAEGTTVPATVVAYDDATGFGLVRPLRALTQKPIPLGSASPVGQLDRLMVVNGGEDQTLSIATVVSKRKFAGYWEYMIDDAIFTAPPRLDHSGAALINQQGELVGIGSLLVMDAVTPGEKLPGNMFVPVDLAKPLLAEMVRTGHREAQARPWLGVDSLEEDGRVKVLQVDEESPAEQAGIEAGDIILSLNGEPVGSLEKFYGLLWSRGGPGVVVNLTVLHGPSVREVPVRSIDRGAFVRRKSGI